MHNAENRNEDDLGSASFREADCENAGPSYNSDKFEETDFSRSKSQSEDLERKFAEKRDNGGDFLPLQRETPDSKPFPLSALGSILGDAARKIFELVKAPDSICGGSFLAAAALCVQGHRNVLIDGRTIPLSGYFLTIAVSGDRKSSIDKLALRSIRLYEEQVLKPEFEKEMVRYRNEHDAWMAKRRHILRVCPDDMNEQLQALIEPKRPLEPIIKCEEPTIEALQRLFHLGRPSLGLFSDEGARFFGGHAMNQENLSKTISCLSKLWDADGPITRIRCEERIQLYGRRLSSHLMLQPTIFRNLISNHTLRDQGILARFLIACPPQVGGIPIYEKLDPTTDPNIKIFWSRCSEILDTQFPLKEGTQNELEPLPLKLSEKAQKYWEDFYIEVEAELGSSGRYRSCYSFAKKIAEHAARIGGILECFDDLMASMISVETMQRAIAIARWYLEEALRIVGIAEHDEELELAQKVYEFLHKRNEQSFHLRLLYKDGPTQVRTKKKADRMMEILLQHGRAYRVERKKDWWTLATTATCDK